MRSLLLLIAVLIGAYLLFDWYQEQRATPFQKVLLAPDSAKVRRLTIDPVGPEPAFSLVRDGDRWIGQRGSTVAPLVSERVAETLAALAPFRTDSLLTETPTLTAAGATAVTVHLPESEHRFFLKSHQKDFLFSVSGQPETYLLDNPERAALLRPFFAYRDPVVFRAEASRIEHIVQTEGEAVQVFARDSVRQWRALGEFPAYHDSLEFFLAQLQQLRPLSYADDFLEPDGELQTEFVLKDSSLDPIRVRLFQNLRDTTIRILHTSQRSNDYIILPTSFRLPSFVDYDPGR